MTTCCASPRPTSLAVCLSLLFGLSAMVFAPIAAAQTPKSSAARKAPAKPEPLSAQQLEVAQQVVAGRMPCEFKAFVQIDADRTLAGHFVLTGKGFRYLMVPVPTTTGAVRLEDAKAGTVWLQLPNKSMLMDQKRGRRLLDECYSPAQTAVAEQLKRQPHQTLVGPSHQ